VPGAYQYLVKVRHIASADWYYILQYPSAKAQPQNRNVFFCRNPSRHGRLRIFDFEITEYLQNLQTDLILSRYDFEDNQYLQNPSFETGFTRQSVIRTAV
jgi:hypothetical protein